MTDAVKVGFVPFSTAPKGVLVVFTDESMKFGPASRKLLAGAEETIKRAAAASDFKGKSGSALDILAPQGLKAARLIVSGTGKAGSVKEEDFIKLGGAVTGKLGSSATAVMIVAELPGGPMKPHQAASIAAGARLRGYKFDRYKTKTKDKDKALAAQVSVAVADVAAARKAFTRDANIVDGVLLARELVNEPPNVLFPAEFARRAAQLRKLGVQVDILDVKAMTKLGMGALLGVSQGSYHEGRMVVMRWNGAANKSDKPVAFVGKGVCFDTGGISIQPAAGMNSRLVIALDAVKIDSASGRWAGETLSAIIACDGASPAASPAPIRNRHAARCQPFATHPVTAVIRLHSANPAPTMLRRFERSARLAIGTPSSE